jgi:hypothetical protein
MQLPRDKVRLRDNFKLKLKEMYAQNSRMKFNNDCFINRYLEGD